MSPGTISPPAMITNVRILRGTAEGIQKAAEEAEDEARRTTLSAKEAERELAVAGQFNRVLSEPHRSHHIKRIEEQPGQFEELVKVPDFIARRTDVRVRKAKIQHQKHNFRLLFIHLTQPDGSK